jgi:hypothetical protein
MHFTVTRGYFDCMKYLIESNADINVRDASGRILLHLATVTG